MTIASTAYNLLVGCAPLCREGRLHGLWNRAFVRASEQFGGPVRTQIHGHDVVVNFGYSYPIFARRYPELNNPLIELVAQTHKAAGRAITVVDVGAAVGDTVLLLRENCADMVSQYYCIDGDPEFLDYLNQNTAAFDNVQVIPAILSASTSETPAPVRTHAGTASLQGSSTVLAHTLDSLLSEAPFTVDLLKIDVDGYDGRVLSGAHHLLQRQKPTVIFEWHPIICASTNTDHLEHFRALMATGYERFIWFDKYGSFNHITVLPSTTHLDRMADYCKHTRAQFDWHFDIIALHNSSAVDPVELADCSFARHRRSRF